MGKKVLGIEIGCDTIKFAVIKKGVIKKLVVQTMPDSLVRDGLPISDAAFINFLKTAIRSNKIPRCECALVLPPQKVISTNLTLPIMSEQKLKLNLPFEFRDFVGSESTLFEYDYVVRSIQEDTMELFVSAIRREIVETYCTLFKKAGITVIAAMPSEMAFLNVIRNQQNLPAQFATIDLGFSRTRINIFQNEEFITGKDVEVGGKLMDEAIAAAQTIDVHLARMRKEANHDQVQTADYMNDRYVAIAVDVLKTINFYNFSRSSEEAPLQDLYYCGGCANIEPLLDSIGRATGLNLHHVSELAGIFENDPRRQQALSCMQAIGAALQITK